MSHLHQAITNILEAVREDTDDMKWREKHFFFKKPRKITGLKKYE
jgi:hypothetical protein